MFLILTFLAGWGVIWGWNVRHFFIICSKKVFPSSLEVNCLIRNFIRLSNCLFHFNYICERTSKMYQISRSKWNWCNNNTQQCLIYNCIFYLGANKETCITIYEKPENSHGEVGVMLYREIYFKILWSSLSNWDSSNFVLICFTNESMWDAKG